MRSRVGEPTHDRRAVEAPERQTLLVRECAGDLKLRAELERLLAAHDRSAGSIQIPAEVRQRYAAIDIEPPAGYEARPPRVEEPVPQ
ncbi:MAG TPA: hypothetical protein VFG66_11355 [Gemmatimonadales bacterium]|nr:hypothetical protein [Gemmatimonadales bacterium]